MPEGGEWKELLRAAGEARDVALVRYHLGRGVDCNFQHPEFFTSPLFEAIRAGSLEIVSVLVAEGNASLETVEQQTDCTPLEVALEEKQHAICDYLLAQQAKLLLPPKDQSFSLHTIRVCGTLPKEELLYLAGMGHRLVLQSENAPPSLVRELQIETGNVKVYTDGDNANSAAITTTHWIVVANVNQHDQQQQQQILSNVMAQVHNSDHSPPSSPSNSSSTLRRDRILVIVMTGSMTMFHSPAFRLRELDIWLRNNNNNNNKAEIVALVWQPPPAWRRILLFDWDWRSRFHDALWWCLTDDDAVVQGGNKVYNDQKQQVRVSDGPH